MPPHDKHHPRTARTIITSTITTGPNIIATNLITVRTIITSTITIFITTCRRISGSSTNSRGGSARRQPRH